MLKRIVNLYNFLVFFSLIFLVLARLTYLVTGNYMYGTL